MKLSVSIPDDLWREVSKVTSGLSPSHLIQEALRRWIAAHDAPAGYSTAAPAEANEALAALRKRFVDKARQEFERGYRDALATADALEWRDMEWLAVEFRFNIKDWARSWAQSKVQADLKGYKLDEGQLRKLNAIFRVVPGLMPPLGDDYAEPGEVYLRGFAQAMRDIWLHVSEGERKSDDATAEEGSGE